MKYAALLLFVGVASAGSITADKLPHIQGIWPWDRRALTAKALPLIQKGKDIDPILREYKVDERTIERLKEIDSGPLFQERYAHGLVYLAKDFSEKQKALFDVLIPAVEAAQRSLWVHRDRLVRQLGKKPDDPLVQRVVNSHNNQILEIEKRFWRVVGYALTIGQRASIKRLYPQNYATPPDILTHIYQLPGLTGSQANRVRALVKQFESENAGDAAELGRIYARLKDKKLSQEERATLTKRSVEVSDSGARRLKHVIELSIPIYTKEQIQHIDALVPLLAAFERGRHPGDLMKGVVLRPEQTKRCHELGGRLHGIFTENGKRLAARTKTLQNADLGSDSPQGMMMTGMSNNAHADNVLAMEEVGREMVLDVYDPRQVVDWVVAPG